MRKRNLNAIEWQPDFCLWCCQDDTFFFWFVFVRMALIRKREQEREMKELEEPCARSGRGVALLAIS